MPAARRHQKHQMMRHWTLNKMLKSGRPRISNILRMWPLQMEGIRRQTSPKDLSALLVGTSIMLSQQSCDDGLGNLPFSATTDSITRHFSTLEPQSVRHCTVKETGKSKGFAFIEFAGYDRMKTCLQYHHSSFDDGISPPRKINVELT